jgi:hypothetical protein
MCNATVCRNGCVEGRRGLGEELRAQGAVDGFQTGPVKRYSLVG